MMFSPILQASATKIGLSFVACSKNYLLKEVCCNNCRQLMLLLQGLLSKSSILFLRFELLLVLLTKVLPPHFIFSYLYSTL